MIFKRFDPWPEGSNDWFAHCLSRGRRAVQGPATWEKIGAWTFQNPAQLACSLHIALIHPPLSRLAQSSRFGDNVRRLCKSDICCKRGPFINQWAICSACFSPVFADLRRYLLGLGQIACVVHAIQELSGIHSKCKHTPYRCRVASQNDRRENACDSIAYVAKDRSCVVCQIPCVTCHASYGILHVSHSIVHELRVVYHLLHIADRLSHIIRRILHVIDHQTQ